MAGKYNKPSLFLEAMHEKPAICRRLQVARLHMNLNSQHQVMCFIKVFFFYAEHTFFYAVIKDIYTYYLINLYS